MANADFINVLKNNILYINRSMFNDFAIDKYPKEMLAAMEIIRINGVLAVILAEGYCTNDMLGFFIKMKAANQDKNLIKKAIIEWVEICEEVFGVSNEIDLNDIIEVSNSKYNPRLGYEPYLRLSDIYDYNECMKKYRDGNIDLETIGTIIAILNNYLFSPVSFADIEYLHELDNYDGKWGEMDSVDENKRKALEILEEVLSPLENYSCLSLRYLIWLAQVRLLSGEYKEAAMLYEFALKADELNEAKDRYTNIRSDELEISAEIAHNIICAYTLGGEKEEAARAKRKYRELLDMQAKHYVDWGEKRYADKPEKEKNRMKEYCEEKAYNIVEKTDYIYMELCVQGFVHKVPSHNTLRTIYDLCQKYNNGYLLGYCFEEIGIELKPSDELIVSDYLLPSRTIYMTLDTYVAKVKNENKTFNKETINQSIDAGNDSYKKLNKLIGLDEIKKDVSNLVNLVRMQIRRQEQGLKPIPVSLHLVFSGNPGTGKTTIARILAEIYKEIGVLSKGQLIEVDRSGLVAGYVGQTALKTQEKINEALGGILFVDEAYALAKNSNDDYGQEAIDTILKAMEDHRDDFVVIVAGYTEPMKKFINSNPGLRSRFNKYINFPDYSADELVQIFKSMCEEYQYKLTGDAEKIMAEKLYYMEAHKDENFANARDVRNMFEEVVTNQASRLAEDPSGDIMEITAEDFN